MALIEGSFREGIRFFQEKQEEIHKNLLHSFLTWSDDYFYQNKIILAHIIINEPEYQCEIISLLTSYSVTCAGYNILIKLPGEAWKLHTCQEKLKDVNCDECGNELDTQLGPCYISCQIIDRDNVSEEEFKNHNSYDLCPICAENKSELFLSQTMEKINCNTYNYFGYNTYSLPNLKNYIQWNRNSQQISDIKKPIEIDDKEYQIIKKNSYIYWNLKINQKETNLTKNYDNFLDKLGIEKLI